MRGNYFFSRSNNCFNPSSTSLLGLFKGGFGFPFHGEDKEDVLSVGGSEDGLSCS